MISEAYPLQWPMARPRTSRYNRKGDPFHVPAGKIRHDLLNELRKMGVTDFVISSNLMVRQDGLPYANQKAPEDPGVALYFTRKGKDICISCDQYSLVDVNLRAIGKTIEAIRGIERWGTEEMMDQAFTGFAALPESIIVTPYTARAWHEILQVSSEADHAVVKAAYRNLSAKYHPDSQDTGDENKFMEVQSAYEQYKKQKGIN